MCCTICCLLCLQTYTYKGKLIGRFYDDSGAATAALDSVHARCGGGARVLLHWWNIPCMMWYCVSAGYMAILLIHGKLLLCCVRYSGAVHALLHLQNTISILLHIVAEGGYMAHV
jgi:hypothetical protein